MFFHEKFEKLYHYENYPTLVLLAGFSVNTCKMSETNVGSKDLNLVDNDQKVEVNNDSSSQEIPKDLEKAEDNPMPTQAQEVLPFFCRYYPNLLICPLSPLQGI